MADASAQMMPKRLWVAGVEYVQADEIIRYRKALEKIARLRTDLSGDFSIGSRQSDIARAALRTQDEI